MSLEISLYAVRMMLSSLAVWLFRIYGLGCRNRKTALLLFGAFAVYMFAVPYWLISRMGFYPYSHIAILVPLLPSLVIIPLISCDSLPQTLFLHFTSMNAVLALTIAASMIRARCELGQPATICLLLVMTALLFCWSLKHFVKPLRFMADNLAGDWWLMTAVSVFVIIVVLCVSVYAEGRFHVHALFAGFTDLAVELAYFMFVTVTCRNLRSISELNEKLLGRDLLRIQLNAMRQYLSIAGEAGDRARIAEHDRRHFENTLRELLLSGNTDRALELLEQTGDKSLPPRRFCKNEVANASVAYYAGLAERSGVRFEAGLDLPEKLPVDSLDLAIVLSNLLENALNACAALPAGQRTVRLRGLLRVQLMIEIENSCAEDVSFDKGGRPVTSREGHGLGAKSVAAFAEKYGASVDYSLENSLFRVRLLI
jgi:signal transduction histidine kinase